MNNPHNTYNRRHGFRDQVRGGSIEAKSQESIMGAVETNIKKSERKDDEHNVQSTTLPKPQHILHKMPFLLEPIPLMALDANPGVRSLTLVKRASSSSTQTDCTLRQGLIRRQAQTAHQLGMHMHTVPLGPLVVGLFGGGGGPDCASCGLWEDRERQTRRTAAGRGERGRKRASTIRPTFHGPFRSPGIQEGKCFFFCKPVAAASNQCAGDVYRRNRAGEASSRQTSASMERHSLR